MQAATSKGRPSIRRTAPDTGGRPYHFGWSTVTKGESRRGRKGAGDAAAGGGADVPAPGGAGKGGKGAGPAPKGGRGKGRPIPNTREAAHQVYVERDAAVEKDATAIDGAMDLGATRETGMGRAAAGWAGPGREDGGPELGGPEIGGPGTAQGLAAPAQRADQEVEQEPGIPGAAAGVDAAAGLDAPGRKKRPSEKERAAAEKLVREHVEGLAADRQGLSMRTGEAAAQVYIEDPSKAPAALQGTTASFGTIGATLEERLNFWDLVHEHESAKGGRTQSRVVLELPHEATPADRHEIVRRFTDEFRRKGIPFWASIHAPTKANDARNHHAHVVFTDRPMRRMAHPDTGAQVWDFTVAETYRNETRHTRVRHPYRQNRDPEMRSRAYVKASRERFAGIVNAVMERSGNAVRYDARSYKDMGLEVAPMRNVSRILADRLGKQPFAVMDAAWTRTMIDAEIQAAAARRDETFVKLQEAEHRMRQVARNIHAVARADARLPPHLRPLPGRALARKAAEAVMEKILTVRRDRLAARFLDEATLSALTHVAEATVSQKAGRGAGRAQAADGGLPDPEAMAALHEAAREEIDALRLSARRRAASAKERELALAREWRGEGLGVPIPPGRPGPDEGGPGRPGPTPGSGPGPGPGSGQDLGPGPSGPSPGRPRTGGPAMTPTPDVIRMPLPQPRPQPRSQPPAAASSRMPLHRQLNASILASLMPAGMPGARPRAPTLPMDEAEPSTASMMAMAALGAKPLVNGRRWHINPAMRFVPGSALDIMHEGNKRQVAEMIEAADGDAEGFAAAVRALPEQWRKEREAQVAEIARLEALAAAAQKRRDEAAAAAAARAAEEKKTEAADKPRVRPPHTGPYLPRPEPSLSERAGIRAGRRGGLADEGEAGRKPSGIASPSSPPPASGAPSPTAASAPQEQPVQLAPSRRMGTSKLQELPPLIHTAVLQPRPPVHGRQSPALDHPQRVVPPPGVDRRMPPNRDDIGETKVIVPGNGAKNTSSQEGRQKHRVAAASDVSQAANQVPPSGPASVSIAKPPRHPADADANGRLRDVDAAAERAWSEPATSGTPPIAAEEDVAVPATAGNEGQARATTNMEIEAARRQRRRKAILAARRRDSPGI